MAQKDRGHYAQKHAPHNKLNQTIAKVVQDKAENGEMSCAIAFKIAGELDVLPAEVGLTLDLLEIPVIQCQLGLFGYRPIKRIVKAAEVISTPLEEAIHSKLVKGRLPCVAAWELAKSLMVPKMAVSKACESLKIKICNCQLGAF
jgi:hypothetical protein